jgi:hypothetical protein
MAPQRRAEEILRLSPRDLLNGRIRSLECRVVKGSKSDVAFCNYNFITPPNSSTRERASFGAASITKLVQTEEEDEAGFEARRAGALLELIKTRLCGKHALGRPTTGALPGDDRSARPSDSLADDDATMTSPRTEQRAASRCDAEDRVHDPPESRNRSKSCIASLAMAAAATPSDSERRRLAPSRLTFSSEELGARFSTNRDFEKERDLADDLNMNSCIVCSGGGLLFCCSNCPLSMCGGCINELCLPMPSDDSVDDLICGVCELRAGAVAITEKAKEKVARLEQVVAEREKEMFELGAALDGEEQKMEDNDETMENLRILIQNFRIGTGEVAPEPSAALDNQKEAVEKLQRGLEFAEAAYSANVKLRSQLAAVTRAASVSRAEIGVLEDFVEKCARAVPDQPAKAAANAEAVAPVRQARGKATGATKGLEMYTRMRKVIIRTLLVIVNIDNNDDDEKW